MTRVPLLLLALAALAAADDPATALAAALREGGQRLEAGQAAAAEESFRRALGIDPGSRHARLGLARCAAERQDWAEACRQLGPALDPASADVSLLAFTADAACRAGDWRLAASAVQFGILRWPDDQRLRRAETALLVGSGREEEARIALRAELARSPGEAARWRELAWAAQATRRGDEALAALEAALLLGEDPGLRRQLTEAQLAAGLPQAALATVTPLAADPALAALAARCAGEAGQPRQGLEWLAAVPAAARSRDQRLLAARLAVQAGAPVAALAALDELVALGERDGLVLAWAAQCAEQAGQLARAEALFALAGNDVHAGVVALAHAAFLVRQGRRGEAVRRLDVHLAAQPGDEPARALRERVLAPSNQR
ncbi:MAG: tetratricopeptide repeat protein [Planctomycetes bacterium]|nr:tetratricopeptide repeat protein [Planctomycetota bacterium]